jgi:hypothetical protein
MNIQEVKKGLEVVYIPRHLRGKSEQFQHRERGEIISWNDLYVFVRFFGDTSSKACQPSDLEVWTCDCGSLPKGSMTCVKHYTQ